MKRDLQDVLRKLREQGWTVTLTKGSHWRCAAPGGGLYFTGSTPSDYRGIKNMKSDLKRMGADL